MKSNRVVLFRILNIILITISVILLLALAAVGAFTILKYQGKSDLHSISGKPELTVPTDSVDSSLSETEAADTAVTVYPDADVVYGGIPYRYNDNLVNILLIGIDKNSTDEKTPLADALYLVVIDDETKEIRVIAVSRNTMTYLRNRTNVQERTQICRAYAYGNSDIDCSERTEETVSQLFYGLPIQNYFTLYMDAIPILTDAIGGVPVTLTEDMSDISPEMTEGASITLSGKKTLLYIRKRDCNTTGSNEQRVSNQEQFITSFAQKALKAVQSDLSLPITLFHTIDDYSITDVSAAGIVYLASSASEYQFKGILTVPGTTGNDGIYDTYDVDQKELFELVLSVFYTQIN